MRKRILFLAESIDVDDSSGTKGRVALLKNLVAAEHDVKVIHYSGKNIQIDDIPCERIAERKLSANFVLSRVQRLLNRYLGINISERVESIFGFSFSFFNDANSIAAALRKHEIKEYDIIITLSKGNSYRTHKALLKLPQWHSKWFAYIHDPYPQQLYPRPFNYVPRGYRSKRLFFNKVTTKATKTIFPSLLLKEWMQSYYGHVASKSVIIPHQIDDSLVVNTPPSYLDTSKFNILFAGNLLDLRNPDVVVEAYQNFITSNNEAARDSRLYFIGNMGSFKPYLDEKRAEISNLYVSDGYVAFQEVYAMQHHASVNVILDAKAEISPFLPGKFPHCVAANNPIIYIGPYYSETKRVLGTEYPYLFDFDKIDDITNAFEELFAKWKNNAESLCLNRPDLRTYLSTTFLKSQLEQNSNS